MSEWSPVIIGVYASIFLFYFLFTIFATFKDWEIAEKDKAEEVEKEAAERKEKAEEEATERKEKAEEEATERKEKAAEKLAEQKEKASENEERAAEKEKHEGDKIYGQRSRAQAYDHLQGTICPGYHRICDKTQLCLCRAGLQSPKAKKRPPSTATLQKNTKQGGTHLEAMIKLLEKRQDKAETENNKLKDQLASYKSEITAAAATISGLRETVDNHESTIDALRTEVEELEASAERRRAAFASATRAIVTSVGRRGWGSQGERGVRGVSGNP